MDKLPTITQLNGASSSDFKKAVDTLFEMSPPLARDLFASKPFSSYTHLIETAASIINAMSVADKLETVNAHPRIGAPAANLSALSKKEQSAGQQEPGLEKTLETLARLNSLYEDKFGFKFVVFVNGRSRSDIVKVLEQRMASGTKESEMQIGLEAMISIAKDRLKKLEGPSKL